MNAIPTRSPRYYTPGEHRQRFFEPPAAEFRQLRTASSRTTASDRTRVMRGSACFARRYSTSIATPAGSASTATTISLPERTRASSTRVITSPTRSLARCAGVSLPRKPVTMAPLFVLRKQRPSQAFLPWNSVRMRSLNCGVTTGGGAGAEPILFSGGDEDEGVGEMAAHPASAGSAANTILQAIPTSPAETPADSRMIDRWR